jgi:uncharacterized protein (TIGR03435 family)
MKNTLFLLVFASLHCLAQPPAGPQSPAPAFEVASVRVSGRENIPNSGPPVLTSPGSLNIHGLSLWGCILLAYQMPEQIVAPDWLNSVHLVIEAKAATPVGDDQLYLRLRTLLTERMGVKAHFERKEMPVYALTLARGGPKFSESATEGPMAIGEDRGVPVPQRVSMRTLATELSRGFDRPVVDATGLKGHYDLRFDMNAPYRANRGDRFGAMNAMIAALEEQLGIKVESRRDFVDVLVVDHAEKVPTGTEARQNPRDETS